jgi:glutathione S-transferase
LHIIAISNTLDLKVGRWSASLSLHTFSLSKIAFLDLRHPIYPPKHTLPTTMPAPITPLILFSYNTSPYGQKIHLLLTAAGLSYSELTQPAVLPRPDLKSLSITYRRIPLLAIGRDVYADSSAILSAILSVLGASSKIATTPADAAYEVWGNETFKSVLPLLPPQATQSEAFVKDRESIFPIIGKLEVLKSLEPIALAELKSRLKTVEEVFLANGPYIGGERLSMADVHVVWVLRWVLQGMLLVLCGLVDLEDADIDKAVQQDWEPRNVSLASTRRLSLKSGT